MRNDVENALIASFEQSPAHGCDWRSRAMTSFAAQGLPTRRRESWHYTDMRAAMRQAAPTRAPDAAAIDIARQRIAACPLAYACRVTLLDGIYQPALSDLRAVENLSVTSVAEVFEDPKAASRLAQIFAFENPGQDDLSEGDPMLALNAALAQGGAFIEIAAGAEIEQPILLFNLMSAGAAHAAYTRSYIRLGSHARVKLVEIYENSGSETQAHDALIIDVGADARLNHVAVLTHDGAQSFAAQSILAQLGADAHYETISLIKNSNFARRQIFARLAGERANFSARHLSMLRGREHADNTLLVEHLAPHGRSREFFRHILNDQSIGVYQGKVRVRSEAQKTDGGMKSQALTLSDDAAMFNKPELEIFADDVVCGHGATVGQLDEDQLFYLQARGLARQQAEALLLEAFAIEAICAEGSPAEAGAEMDDEIENWLSDQARIWLTRGADENLRAEKTS